MGPDVGVGFGPGSPLQTLLVYTCYEGMGGSLLFTSAVSAQAI